MWQTIATDQIWMQDDFLSEDELTHVLKEWELFTSFHTIEQKKEEYLLAPTYYHSKQPKRPPRSKKKIQTFVIDRLNTLYPNVFGKTADTDNLTYAQFYFKENEPNVSRYDLHVEPGPGEKNSFGDCVFMLYLSDEVDGPITAPSLADAQTLINDVYDKSVSEMVIRYVDQTVSIVPKKNRCVVMRNGTPHYVPTGSGVRKCITGWSFMPRKLRNRTDEL
jgi:hypothetical protein